MGRLVTLLRGSLKLAVYFKQNQNWRVLTCNMADFRPHKRAAFGSVCVCRPLGLRCHVINCALPLVSRVHVSS